MGRKRSPMEGDDGRTVADMSDVSGGLLSGRRPSEKRKKKVSEREAEDGGSTYQMPYTGKERWRYTLAALKAALLIGGVYLIGLGLVIFLLILLWS